jgi:hypothetical protein
MKSAVAKIVIFLACGACSLAPPAQPARAEPGQTFSLKAGESARAEGGAWEIGFEGVTADSRCPKGERCVWAGDATVRVWLKKAGGVRTASELHTAPNVPSAPNATNSSNAPNAPNAPNVPTADAPRITLRLVRLDPPALAGRPIAKGDYVATLALERDAPGAAAER